MYVFVNCTVFTLATSANDGTDSWPAAEVRATSFPFTVAVAVQPVPLGGVSDTVQLWPSLAPVSVGVADSPLPSPAVVKLDGHDPEKTIFVLACGEPVGALTIDATLRLAAGGGAGIHRC